MSPMPKPRLLWVEDEMERMGQLLQMVERAGFEVAKAGSVGEARDRLSTETLDILLLDIMLPVDIPEWGQSSPWVAGIRLLRELRDGRISGARSDLPVVVLSGTCDANYLKQMDALGISRRFEKPVRSRDLLEALHAATGAI